MSDGALDLQKHDGQEILLVRAYGSSFLTLGINIRNGRFLLCSSKNIISSKALLECEEALNQGSTTAVEAFINLRANSILHLFACIGRFLGLEISQDGNSMICIVVQMPYSCQVFENGFMPTKLPENVSDDSNSLIMGFPECGSSYFLLMQLDKEFKPCPKLVEAQAEPSRKALPFGDTGKVTRVKNLDINRMHMCQDDLNLSLFDRKVPSIFNDGNVNKICENGLLSNSSSEGSMLRSNLPLSFSSIVDEVFDLEKGSDVQSASSTSGLSPASHFDLGTMNSVKPSIHHKLL